VTRGRAPRGGIDLGGTKIQTAVVDAKGKVTGEARHPTPTDGGPADVATAMAEAMREAAGLAEVDTEDLEGVGVGSPGDADPKTGVVSGAKNLPGWEGSFPLAETLAGELGTEVRVGNDVQVATEAEFHLGAGREFSTLIGVFWGTGVGGGLIIDGKP
jgi:glucokinase